MPPWKNRIPKFRDHYATGRAVVTIDGKHIYLGRTGLHHRGARGAQGRHCTQTTASTREKPIKLVVRRLRRRYGPVAAADFDPPALRTLQRAMPTQHGREARLRDAA